ncbi:hypothetical protein [Sphingorhabdus lutea]|uniref:hypothetical protein n=1 Tax=Sphingorhabdus lutea TaxID=1913578 RepID=UPI000A7A5E87|nr:hypothetical protein [Sphingorhabdus lutea]
MDDRLGQILYSIALLTLVGSALAYRNLSLGSMAKMAIIWVGLFAIAGIIFGIIMG